MDNKAVRLYVNVDEYEGVVRYEPDWIELTKGWTEHDARKNAVENLRESLTIIFPNELIDIEV